MKNIEFAIFRQNVSKSRIGCTRFLKSLHYTTKPSSSTSDPSAYRSVNAYEVAGVGRRASPAVAVEGVVLTEETCDGEWDDKCFTDSGRSGQSRSTIACPGVNKIKIKSN